MIIDRYFENCELLQLDVKGDERGSLIALEGGRNLPFEIARVYYLFGTLPGVSRGFHAHRALDQIAVCVRGGCTVLVDDGAERLEIRLEQPDRALRLGPMVWHEMHDFTPDSVFMVLADALYDEADYIRDYATFRHSRAAGAAE